MIRPANCPDANSLVGMLDGELEPLSQSAITEHVDDCITCQSRLETLVTEGLREDLKFDQIATHLRAGLEEHSLEFSVDDVGQMTETLLRTFPVSCPGTVIDFLEPSEDPNSLGRLGQYEVTEVIGRGGMGIAMKARDTRLSRIVALKVLAPELASNPTARRRFLREARAAAAVSHDHVVTVHAVEPSDLPYLAMEYIDGCSLQQKIDRCGPLDVTEILRMGRQTALGLAAAHAQGLIHHDIKPSNIMLQNSVERVQITDFGLARAVDDVSITRTGEVRGTPQYMSPEQAQGLPTDSRSDLFSLGAVLYAMCTCRAPFRAESTMGVLHRVCNDAPRPIPEVNPEIPSWLIAIIDRLMEKNRDDRYQTAKEVGDVLSQYLAHVQQPTVVPLPAPAPATRRSKAWDFRRTRHFGPMAALMLMVGLAMSEATGVTNLAATVLRITMGEGTLVIEVDDPSVEVSLDGEELTITGAGIQELKLRPGQYRFQATKNGESLRQELVTITRGGEQVVSVTRELNDVKLPSRSLSSGTPKYGFVSLFDGRTLEGWQGDVHAFSVQNGALIASGRGNLFTTQTYSDFILELEYRLSPAANCGVAIRSPLVGDPAYAGCEIQILDDSSYYDLPDYCRNGSIWGIVAATPGNLKETPQWNHQEIRCAAGEVRVTLNGAVIVDVDLAKVDKPADGRDHPGLTRVSGHIGLMSATTQVEYGSQVEFRNIRIKELARSRPRASEAQRKLPKRNEESGKSGAR